MAAKGKNCYFQVSIDGEHIGRIEFELFDNVVPKTAKNFRQLCTGQNGFGYKGCAFHRIIRHFMLQGGDFTNHNGTGGKSIYDKETFADENFTIGHMEPGILSMANAGKDTNGSQFFITLVGCPWLNNHHVAFGKVVKGYDDVVKKIEEKGSQSGKPSARCIIEDCGVVKD